MLLILKASLYFADLFPELLSIPQLITEMRAVERSRFESVSAFQTILHKPPSSGIVFGIPAILNHGFNLCTLQLSYSYDHPDRLGEHLTNLTR